MADGIPPWLNIDPLRPVQFFLQGTSTGVGAAEARNRAQAAAMELAQRAAAQQAANERAALAAQADAAQTAARTELIQQQRELNQQKAALMARKYAASNNIRDAIARGVPEAQAFFQNPDFFLDAETAIPGLIRDTTPFNPEIIDVDGTKVMRTSRGQVQILPQGASTGPVQTVPIINSAGQQVGEGIRGPSGGVQQVATERAGALSPEQSRRLALWEKQADRAEKTMFNIEKDTPDPTTLETNKTYQGARQRFDEAEREQRKILGLPVEEAAPPKEQPTGRYGVFDPKTGKITYREVAPPITTPAPVAAPAKPVGAAPPLPQQSLLERLGSLPVPTLPPAAIGALTNAANYIGETPLMRLVTPGD